MKLRHILATAGAVAAAIAIPAASATAAPAPHHARLLPFLSVTPKAIVPPDVNAIAICDVVTRDQCVASQGNYHNVDYGNQFANTGRSFAVDLKAANICGGDNKVTATCPFSNTSVDSSYLGDYIQTIEFWDIGTDNQYVTSNGTSGQAWNAPVGSSASTFVDNPVGSAGNFRMINVYYTNKATGNGTPAAYLADDAKFYGRPLIIEENPAGEGDRYTWFHFPFVPGNPMSPASG